MYSMPTKDPTNNHTNRIWMSEKKVALGYEILAW